MKIWKKAMLLMVLLMALSLFSCGGGSEEPQDAGESAQTEAEAGAAGEAIENWPSDNSIAQKIPVCTSGSIMDITEETHSIFIMVGDVSRDASIAYWEQAQSDGYTNVTSESDTPVTGGFTYVASNDENISLSVTWSPGSGEGTLSVLAIQY
ncbi:MAG: hypothetical protein Q4C25_04610 [Bacillota bacterium]|nr:hypothetical protein [Bacillota bacterium]